MKLLQFGSVFLSSAGIVKIETFPTDVNHVLKVIVTLMTGEKLDLGKMNKSAFRRLMDGFVCADNISDKDPEVIS